MALVDEHLDKARVIEKALMRIKDISSAKARRR